MLRGGMPVCGGHTNGWQESMEVNTRYKSNISQVSEDHQRGSEVAFVLDVISTMAVLLRSWT